MWMKKEEWVNEAPLDALAPYLHIKALSGFVKGSESYTAFMYTLIEGRSY